MTRALTLHQPWASLIAVGAKHIETRSWRTEYRGRLLIHAAARQPEPVRPSDPALGAYCVGMVHDPGGGTWWAMERNEDDRRWPLPLGAVVASCVLTDCVPIVAFDEAIRADLGDLPLPRIETRVGPQWLPDGEVFLCDEADETGRRLPGEASFGDFSPGRFAWLLDDVKPTTERCPRCWGSRVVPWLGAGVDPGVRCSTCNAAGACEPVPMRGRQGLWTSTWAAS